MTLYLDTETTGLSPVKGDAIVEVAIVDGSGRSVLDTLVNPGRSIPWQASSIHGITDDMVRGKPTLAQLMPRVLEIIESEQVIIYNARFDAPFFPGGLSQAKIVECAMLRFADVRGGRWQKLDVAAQHVGHRWTGAAHRALADALACRSVWNWLVERGHASNWVSSSTRIGREYDSTLEREKKSIVEKRAARAERPGSLKQAPTEEACKSSINSYRSSHKDSAGNASSYYRSYDERTPSADETERRVTEKAASRSIPQQKFWIYNRANMTLLHRASGLTFSKESYYRDGAGYVVRDKVHPWVPDSDIEMIG